MKERATCNNRISIRVSRIEHATLSAHLHRLLTEEHARSFVEAFCTEAARITREHQGCGTIAQQKLGLVDAELTHLEQNLLKGVFSPALQRLLTEREAAKARLEAQLAIKPPPPPLADILPHPVLLQRFEAKVDNLRAALNNDAIRAEAAQVIAELIESVTIHPAARRGQRRR